MISAPLINKVISLLNTRKSRLLTYAQLAMTEYQFKAYKTLLLDELGERGLEKELKEMLNEKQYGESRNGRE